MTRDELAVRFPHMYKILEELATDNGMHWQPEITESEIVLANYEAKAVQLTDEEKMILAAGDYDEQQQIVQRTGFHDLDEYLGEVFDGELRTKFFSYQ